MFQLPTRVGNWKLKQKKGNFSPFENIVKIEDFSNILTSAARWMQTEVFLHVGDVKHGLKPALSL